MHEPETKERVLFTTMEEGSGATWGFQAGYTFSQRFKALQSGIPSELGIRMGNHENPFSARLRIYIDDRLVFERDYSGLKQRSADLATVFELSGMTAVVQANSWVRVSITPDTLIGIEPVFSEDPDVPLAELPRYGKMAARFYMNCR